MSFLRTFLLLASLLIYASAHGQGQYRRSEFRFGLMKPIWPGAASLEESLPNLHVSYRYHFSNRIFLLAEVESNSDAQILDNGRYDNFLTYRIDFSRDYLSPTLGAGRLWRWKGFEASASAAFSVRYLFQAGYHWHVKGSDVPANHDASGGYGFSFAMKDATPTWMPTAKVRLGIQYHITNWVGIFADFQYGYDLVRFDPNAISLIQTFDKEDNVSYSETHSYRATSLPRS